MYDFEAKRSTDERRPRELRITHHLLYADLDAALKLVPAAIELLNSTASYAELASILPLSNNALPTTIAALEERGYLLRGPRRRKKGSIFYEKTTYRLLKDANPHAGYFVRLPLTDDLERSPKPWILRALVHREQQRAGAYQLPPALAARFTGMTPKSVKNSIRKWVTNGILEEVQAGSGRRAGVYAAADSPYARRDNFDPTRYRLHRVARCGEEVAVWATEKQHRMIAARLRNAPDVDAVNLIVATPQPALAGELIAALEPFADDAHRIPF
jgi:hypothetical protein